ncbi:MAG TPA: class I lanthipeptide [Thermoanaerobaculia bacterium]|jgi:hypothetical protein|nr:class I lanthipeptide [Thermoanaerobaculia bacterium]
MKKKLNDKLALRKETVRMLTGLDLAGAYGGGTTSNTNTSNVTDTCATCIGISCQHAPITTGNTTSVCC